MTIDGYVIAKTGAEGISTHTFGRTMSEAWSRFIGRPYVDAGEAATLRSRWAQRGWVPVPATLTIEESS